MQCPDCHGHAAGNEREPECPRCDGKGWGEEEAMTLREKVADMFCPDGGRPDGPCSRCLAIADRILALTEADYNPMCKGEHFDLCLKDMKGYIAERERKAFTDGVIWSESDCVSMTGAIAEAARRYP